MAWLPKLSHTPEVKKRIWIRLHQITRWVRHLAMHSVRAISYNSIVDIKSL